MPSALCYSALSCICCSTSAPDAAALLSCLPIADPVLISLCALQKDAPRLFAALPEAVSLSEVSLMDPEESEEGSDVYASLHSALAAVRAGSCRAAAAGLLSCQVC